MNERKEEEKQRPKSLQQRGIREQFLRKKVLGRQRERERDANVKAMY